MMQTGRKKTVFILAALIVLALGVALVGNTLATGINRNSQADELKGQAGVYNVDISYLAADKHYVSLNVQDGASFSKDMFWCPGRTEIVYLKITNYEKFIVECSPILSVSKDSTQTANLGDVLTYAVIHNLKTPADLQDYSNWDQFLNAANDPNGIGGSGRLSVDDHVAFKTADNKSVMFPLAAASVNDAGKMIPADNGNAYFALAIHMDEDASNSYQNAKLNLLINLKVDANYKPGADPNQSGVETSD